jgi:hypothetical protein
MPTSLLWLARLLLELPVIANLYDLLAHDLDELFVGLPWTIASFPLLQCTDVRYHSSRSAFRGIVEERTCILRHVHGAIAP